MKTRHNHRNTTSRRRRRVVKQQRVQTRIHRRKGTAVSSRRRDYFFKRGGQSPPCEEKNIDSDILQLVKRVTIYEIPCTVECVHDITGLYRPTKDSTSLDITTSSNKTLIFRILEKEPGKQSVYIFNLNSLNKEEVIYGRIIMVNGNENIVLYHPLVAAEIFLKLKTLKP